MSIAFVLFCLWFVLGAWIERDSQQTMGGIIIPNDGHSEAQFARALHKIDERN